jgi:hypothetical protein
LLVASRLITAWEIGEAAAATKPRPLGKFGSAVVQRIRIEPVRTRPILPRITAAELERCPNCECSPHRCGCDDYLDKQEVFS